MAKIYLQKIPSAIADNGKPLSMISKSEIVTKAGWYYDATDKILWIKSDGKKINNEWNISL